MKRKILIFTAIMFIVSTFTNVFTMADTNNVGFADIKQSDYYADAVINLVKNGYISGYPDGTFRGENPVTRAEMAVLVSRINNTENIAKSRTGYSSFIDISSDYWANGYINVAKENGIINGYKDGSFLPEHCITFEEAVKMIVCAAGYGDNVAIDIDNWAKGYLEIASEKGITKYLYGKENTISNRADIAIMIYNLISSKDFNADKKYAIRWKTDDPDDLGERYFDAKNLSAKIGVGEMNGYSDFDNIYPWSEIKRCNISADKKIVFEGEEGFSLDGSNGDVFVRIPKFYVEKYIEDGYEYRVISQTGQKVHSAFIENGKELDEIFIAAYEGYIENNKLRSIADVIPTSNEVAQTYLSAAIRNGRNYSLYDLRCVDAVWTLMAVEYGCRNSNRILGYGVSDLLQPVMDYAPCVKREINTNSITVKLKYKSTINNIPVGTNITVCKDTQLNILTQAKILDVKESEDGEYVTFTFDGKPIDVDTSCFVGSAAMHTNSSESEERGLIWHTGRADFIPGSIYMNSIRYRWMENIFGNLWEYMPDVTFENGIMYLCENMRYYRFGASDNGYERMNEEFIVQNSNGRKSDNAEENYWISEMKTSLNEKDITLGNTYDMSLTSKKAFGAYYYVSDQGTRFIANGGGFDHLYRCNILTSRAWITLDKMWYLYGARMMYKPVE